MALVDQDLVTAEQRQMVKAVCDAVAVLNKALRDASAVGIYVELRDTNSIGDRNPQYFVEKHELRIMVLPPAGAS